MRKKGVQGCACEKKIEPFLATTSTFLKHVIYSRAQYRHHVPAVIHLLKSELCRDMAKDWSSVLFNIKKHTECMLNILH